MLLTDILDKFKEDLTEDEIIYILQKKNTFMEAGKSELEASKLAIKEIQEFLIKSLRGIYSQLKIDNDKTKLSIFIEKFINA